MEGALLFTLKPAPWAWMLLDNVPNGLRSWMASVTRIRLFSSCSKASFNLSCRVVSLFAFFIFFEFCFCMYWHANAKQRVAFQPLATQNFFLLHFRVLLSSVKTVRASSAAPRVAGFSTTAFSLSTLPVFWPVFLSSQL